MSKSVCRLCLSAILGLLVSGCGSGIKLDEIQGTVTFDGNPLPYGTVEFIPDSSKQHSGPAGLAEVVDGKFSTKQSGQGVLYGPHRVRVAGYQERPPVQEDETAATSTKPLFANYEVQLDIQTAELKIEVPATAAAKPKARPGRAANAP